MNNLGFTILTAALFVGGFGGTYYVTANPGVLDFSSAPSDCDARGEECRARLRAQGERAFARGKVALGDAAYGRAALAGDVRAAFQLGWHHEEAYRRAVGKKLEAGTAPLEEATPGITGLPNGEDFAALTRRYEGVPAGPARPLADRTLAFLWYAHAARDGFGPAMNNLGAMYQFGLMGSRDRLQAQAWYQRASSVQNPVGGLNNRVLAVRYGADCDFESAAAFAGGLSAPAIDLEEDIVTRTRFRGRMVPSGVRSMFKVQNYVANKPTEEMGVLDVMQISAMARAFDDNDLKQDWDDAEEVAAANAVNRDCRERRASAGAGDHSKLKRLREMQEDSERRTAAALRRRL